MERYINISLDLKPIISKQLDFRIPSSMKLKEILQKLKRYEEVIQVSYDDLRLIDYLRMVETDTNIDNIRNLLNDIYRINNTIKLQAIKDKKETR